MQELHINTNFKNNIYLTCHGMRAYKYQICYIAVTVMIVLI